MIEAVDVRHQGLEGAISPYLVEVPEPALVDPGPSTCLDTLREALAGLGVSLGDLRYVFLTHVHLDHAGATGHLVALNPGLEVHVHRHGAPHMADPAKLVSSTRRVFGDAHDRLWGEVLPVPASSLRAWTPGERPPVRGLRPIATPGHIAHHLAYLHEGDGVLLTGDSMGVILHPAAPTHPPTPPPGVDVRAWLDSLERLADYDPDAFGAAHFGIHREFQARRQELAAALASLEERVRSVPPSEDDEARAGYEDEVRSIQAPTVGSDKVRRYFDAFLAANDWAGMRLYVDRHPA